VITDLGVMTPDPVDCELVMTAVHPGVTPEQCAAATGWTLRFADDLSVTDPPTTSELAALRELQAA
jgi:glutaconate CoA-transferase subunit B